MSTPNTDPGLRLAKQVSGNLDALDVRVTEAEAGLRKLKGDVDALAVAVRMDLKSAVRTPPGQRGKAAEDDEEFEGQPNWLEMASPAEAQTTLESAVAWHRRVLVHLDAGLHPCWPWHPNLVAEVLALGELYVWSYAQENPKEVGAFFAHFLATFRNRSRAFFERAQCSATYHQAGGRSWRVDQGAVGEYARWWAGDRQDTPPGLTEVEQ